MTMWDFIKPRHPEALARHMTIGLIKPRHPEVLGAQAPSLEGRDPQEHRMQRRLLGGAYIIHQLLEAA
jgi:hypothetical protein